MFPHNRTFINGFDNFAKSLDAIAKANNVLHPTWLNFMHDSGFAKNQPLLNSFNQINFNTLSGLNFDFLKAFNPLKNMTPSYLLSEQQTLSQLNPEKWLPNYKFKHSDIFNNLELLGESIRENIFFYDKHLTISADITKNFITEARLTSSLEEFNSSNFLSYTRLNSFDVLSANTFLKALKTLEEDDKDPAIAYDEVAQLLKENNELLQEILTMQSTAISLIAPEKNNPETWHKVVDWNTLAEYFMNKVLIQRFDLNPAIAKSLIFIIGLTLIPITFELWTEARGGDAFNSLLGKKESDKEIVPNILMYLPAQPTPPTDITISSTTYVYPITNLNSRSIGTFSNNTTVIILKIKPKWCLVEGNGTIETKRDRKERNKPNRRNKEPRSTKKLRGWIRKENLDMFQ